jgi:hypothetical protein
MFHDSVSSTPSTPDDAAFRALALRLLAMYHPQFGGAVPQDHIQLLPGQIAPEFPSEVPLPPESRMLGSFLSGWESTVVLDCDLTLEQLYDFYAERLPSVGWIRTEPSRGPTAGFTRPHVMSPRLLTRPGLSHIGGPLGSFKALHLAYAHGDPGADGPHLHICATVHETDEPYKSYADPASSGEGRESNERDAGGPADVHLILVSPPHIASMSRREQPMPAHLPVFSPPPDAEQEAEGMSYSGRRRFASSATLFAPGYDVASVGRHYSEQLARVGWIASSAGTSPPATWSTWTLTDREGEPWWATFSAIQLPLTPERYLLNFRANKVQPDAHAG